MTLVEYGVLKEDDRVKYNEKTYRVIVPEYCDGSIFIVSEKCESDAEKVHYSLCEKLPKTAYNTYSFVKLQTYDCVEFDTGERGIVSYIKDEEYKSSKYEISLLEQGITYYIDLNGYIGNDSVVKVWQQETGYCNGIQLSNMLNGEEPTWERG